MSIWAVIPVKPLRLAKSRLSSILSQQEREKFAEAMLRHVLGVVAKVPQITGTLVISRDNYVLSIAREYGAKTIQESGAPELNTALMRATSVVASWRSDALLILPADLPLVSSEDITDIIQLGLQNPESVVIATDRDQNGTNALFAHPPGVIDYAYGEGSFQRHISLAEQSGVAVHVYESDRMWQDIDHPQDIEHYANLVAQGKYEGVFSLEDLQRFTNDHTQPEKP
jgi:2-phospho-L-lactate guanylyltransferase